jgi:divalent metal cation (Fe/Co/Zn/Cd) transporter
MINIARSPSRAHLIQRAFQLEWLTAGWMLVEAAVAIWSGMIAHSLTLIAFGADSIIELLSACMLVWRLSVELRHGEEFSETAERSAAKIGGGLLFALAVYVIASAVSSLWGGRGQEFSKAGLTLAAIAIPLMYFLGTAKLRIAGEIDSGALRADAIESITCCYLSCVVLVGLVAQFLLNAWWVDGVSALVLVPFLLREAWEAWSGEDVD